MIKMFENKYCMRISSTSIFISYAFPFYVSANPSNGLFDFISVPTPVLKVMNQEFSGILYVIRGDNITVTCELPGVSGQAIYQWTGRSPGDNNLTFHNIQPSEAGVYNCTVHPANGDQQTTEQVSLTIVVLSK